MWGQNCLSRIAQSHKNQFQVVRVLSVSPSPASDAMQNTKFYSGALGWDLLRDFLHAEVVSVEAAAVEFALERWIS